MTIGLFIYLAFNIFFVAIFISVNRELFKDLPTIMFLVIGMIFPAIIITSFYIDQYTMKNKKLIRLPNYLDKFKHKEFSVLIVDKEGNKIDIPEDKKLDLSVAVTSILKGRV